jgi:hypothetical protein
MATRKEEHKREMKKDHKKEKKMHEKKKDCGPMKKK